MMKASSRNPSVCVVVGSANMDLVVTTQRFPAPGETVPGTGFSTIPGGKGANQAVCCAKLGGRVEFLGKMGNDRFRDQLRASMKRDGVSLRYTLLDRTASTGIALIAVDGAGQNEIVVVAGSNGRLTPSDVTRQRSLFARAGVVLLQLEIPVPTVARAATLARRAGARVILNPAPALSIPDELFRSIDYLTPNETEAGILSGMPVTSRETAVAAARRLIERGAGQVILTMGSAGCIHVTSEEDVAYPARTVSVVDTTAAGDAFNGALAFAMTIGYDITEAIPFAIDVATLSVTRFGAQSSMPTRPEVERFRRQAVRRTAQISRAGAPPR